MNHQVLRNYRVIHISMRLFRDLHDFNVNKSYADQLIVFSRMFFFSKSNSRMSFSHIQSLVGHFSSMKSFF